MNQEKRDAIQAYLKKQKTDATIGFASDLNLDYGFIEPPIPSLSRLLAKPGCTTGGFPRGKFSVVSGPERCSKSTLSLQTVAYDMEQDPDAFWAWNDVENALEPGYAEMLGIDMDRLIIIKEGIMEDVLQRVIDLAKLNALKGVVIDSVGALTPQGETATSKGVEKTLVNENMLNLQRKIGQFYRLSNTFVSRSACAVIQIAHVYQDPGNHGMYVVKGGNALKHWCHVRLMMNRLKDESTKDEVVMPDGSKESLHKGHDVKIRLDKTRQNANENKYIVVPYRYGVGLDIITSIVNVATNLGIINRAGAWYSFRDLKCQGKSSLIQALKNNNEIYEQIVNQLSLTLTENDI